MCLILRSPGGHVPGGRLRAHRVPGLLGRRPPRHDADDCLAGKLMISTTLYWLVDCHVLAW